MFTSISTFKNPTQNTIYNLGKNVKNKQTCICISTMVAMVCVLQYSGIQYHGQANVHGKSIFIPWYTENMVSHCNPNLYQLL